MIELGRLVMTSGVANWIKENPARYPLINNSITRHKSGDWGDLCDEDKECNNIAVKDGERLLSAYKVDDEKIYIITEWDRSVTTVLFPSEY